MHINYIFRCFGGIVVKATGLSTPTEALVAGSNPTHGTGHFSYASGVYLRLFIGKNVKYDSHASNQAR